MRQKVFTDNDKRILFRKIKRIVRLCLVFAAVLSLALFNAFLPLQSLLPAYGIPARQEGEVRVHFLSVGQGDCSVVEFPDGALVVIDAGDGSFTHANDVLRYIKGLRPTSLTYLVTHADIDHYGGFLQLVAYYGADRVYLPVIDGGGNAYEKLQERISGLSCPASRLSRYGVIENACGAYFVCISPYSIDETDENDASCVLYFDYMGVRILFGGDIGATRERRLMRDYALMEGIFDSKGHTVRLENVDILKVSHHGSAYSSSSAWLNLLSPAYAIVSCGSGNRYFHPSADAVFRLETGGASVLRADELGNIVVHITHEGYTVTTD